MFLTPTMEEEVVDLIKGLDNKKCKKCHSKIKTAFTHIINLSLSTGQFPDQLKIAKVKPLYKKGCDTEVSEVQFHSLWVFQK
jgi:hypothetical protein